MHEKNLWFKIEAGCRFDPCGEIVRQGAYVGGCGVADVDDHVSVPGSDLRSADLQAAKAQLVDDFAGGLAKRGVVLEHRSRRGKTVMALVLAIPTVSVHFGSDGSDFPRFQPERGGKDQHPAALEGAALVAEFPGIGR